MPQKPGNNNPYAQASSAYGDNAQKNAPDQRELEARVLLKSANKLKAIQDNWDNLDLNNLEETLRYNRSIWVMFYDAAIENEGDNRPNDLRSNIINLANFIFKRETEIMTGPEAKKLDILISINRDIAAGLMTSVENEAKEKQKELEQQGQAGTQTQQTPNEPSAQPPYSEQG